MKAKLSILISGALLGVFGVLGAGLVGFSHDVTAERIVQHAKAEASNAAALAKEDLKKSIARRLAAAEDQIASAEASAGR